MPTEYVPVGTDTDLQIRDTRPDSDAQRLSAFLSSISAGYERLLASGGDTQIRERADEQLTSLSLAQAALRFQQSHGKAGRPLQVAVMGPTQTGKSTVVNVLLGCDAAETSPLAGFTVHPQGFWCRGAADSDEWTENIFPEWLCSTPPDLDRSRLESYSLTPVPNAETAISDSLVVWDTPDFDTLMSRTYRRGLIEVAALADIIVLTLSKEKYSDLSVWQMVELLRPLGRPIVFCLNKLPADGVDAIRASLRERIETVGMRASDAAVCCLPFASRLGAQPSPRFDVAAATLRDRVQVALPWARSADPAAGVRALLAANWDGWIAPIRAEHAARTAWKKCVAGACDDFLHEYRRDFLDHPQRFDSLKRATVELLHLLELPGIAAALTRIRAVVTWPARKLFAHGRAWLGSTRPIAGGPAGEELVAHAAIDRLLTRLSRDAGRRAGETSHAARVWSSLAATLAAAEGDLRRQFQSAVAAHREAFEDEIRAAANRLYAALRERPAVLNTLRMARVTADAAAVALAIKSGGLGMNDLLFGPAMLGVTTLLTEGALGAYMTRVADELRREQFSQFRATVVETVIARELLAVARRSDGEGLFGISPSELSAAEKIRDAWGAGG